MKSSFLITVIIIFLFAGLSVHSQTKTNYKNLHAVKDKVTILRYNTFFHSFLISRNRNKYIELEITGVDSIPDFDIKNLNISIYDSENKEIRYRFCSFGERSFDGTPKRCRKYEERDEYKKCDSDKSTSNVVKVKFPVRIRYVNPYSSAQFGYKMVPGNYSIIIIYKEHCRPVMTDTVNLKVIGILKN